MAKKTVDILLKACLPILDLSPNTGLIENHMKFHKDILADVIDTIHDELVFGIQDRTDIFYEPYIMEDEAVEWVRRIKN